MAMTNGTPDTGYEVGVTPIDFEGDVIDAASHIYYSGLKNVEEVIKAARELSESGLYKISKEWKIIVSKGKVVEHDIQQSVDDLFNQAKTDVESETKPVIQTPAPEVAPTQSPDVAESNTNDEVTPVVDTSTPNT